MLEKNDFTQGSILPKLLKFMIPILGALIALVSHIMMEPAILLE